MAGRLATLSSGLVIVQVALSLALVVVAALFVRSFERLSHVPLGFDPDRVLVVNVDMQRARTDPADRMLLYQRIVDAAASVPGVAHAGGSIWTPVDGGMRMGDSQSRVMFNFVTPGWFAAYGTAVRIGRDFTVQRHGRASAGRRRERSIRARTHAGTVPARRDDPLPSIAGRRGAAHHRRRRG